MIPLKKLLALSLFISLFFVSCQKETNEGLGPQTLLEQPYGSSSQQTMDIYLPAGRSSANTKVIILIHGGGWNGGDKSDFTAYVDTLKNRLPGYAIFNINYRLANPPDIFPAQEMDVKAAIEFIFNNRAEYNISDKFVLLGASAGGHLALLQAYKYFLPVKVKAVVDFFGPTDLTKMYNNPPNPLVPLLLDFVIGGTPGTNPSLYEQSSPVNFISASSPPTLIFHGGTDIVVSPSQSILLKDDLQAKGISHEYYFYPQEGHGWEGQPLTDSFDKIVAFLSTYLN